MGIRVAVCLVAAMGCGKVHTPTCDDHEQSGTETDVDCGGICGACADDQKCKVSADCQSADCEAGRCAPEVCGDGRIQTGEECDDGGESATCNANCTVAACGDGIVNVTAGEQCEAATQEVWDRCEHCAYGSGLDGTFGTTWQALVAPAGEVYGFQSFHYTGAQYLYDVAGNQRYDIVANSWAALPMAVPFGSTDWDDAAVDTNAMWVPRSSAMWRLDLGTLMWSSITTPVPDGSSNEGAAVFDGHGDIWYSAGADLVRYSPVDGSTQTFAYPTTSIFETRVAYDPISDRIAFNGFGSNAFLIFDLATQLFHTGTANPDGAINDNTCGDNAGGVYTGNGDQSKMYRYDIGADTWSVLPILPVVHDDNSTCVVSQDGYLYYVTATATRYFGRLPLGKK